MRILSERRCSRNVLPLKDSFLCAPVHSESPIRIPVFSRDQAVSSGVYRACKRHRGRSSAYYYTHTTTRRNAMRRDAAFTVKARHKRREWKINGYALRPPLRGPGRIGEDGGRHRRQRH